MIKGLIFAGLCLAASIGVATRAHGTDARDQAHSGIVLAQLTPEQAQCQQEAAQLQSQLAQCGDDQCRQNVQAAIAAHNARCG